jgi:hypothetical protein
MGCARVIADEIEETRGWALNSTCSVVAFEIRSGASSRLIENELGILSGARAASAPFQLLSASDIFVC